MHALKTQRLPFSCEETLDTDHVRLYPKTFQIFIERTQHSRGSPAKARHTKTSPDQGGILAGILGSRIPGNH